MVDTARILVSWDCNLRCSYCCNNIPKFRRQIKPVSLHDICWSAYSAFCISGGEPLLHMDRVEAVCKRIPSGAAVVLNTNGSRITPSTARHLSELGVRYLNVGLHYLGSFAEIIRRVQASVDGLPLTVRYQAMQGYEWYRDQFHPELHWKFWEKDVCERSNEDWFVLEELK